jgi:hypothetical protein
MKNRLARLDGMMRPSSILSKVKMLSDLSCRSALTLNDFSAKIAELGKRQDESIKVKNETDIELVVDLRTTHVRNRI